MKADSFWERWTASWFAPVPIEGLVWFRIVFGSLITWLVFHSYFGLNFLESYYVAPGFTFSYYGFSWVKPLPATGMYIVFWTMAIAGATMAIGFLYRLSTFLVFATWTYVFLCEKAVYQNHHYLVMLLAFWMILIPAHRKFSIDALIWKSIRSDFAPAWSLWTIRLLIAIPYVYGSIAKMNTDWLNARPVWIWVNIGSISHALPEFLKREETAWFISYYGLIFDLLVVPALFWGPTRLLACLGILGFHGTNTFLFAIGIFPPLMIASTLLFFPKNMIPDIVAAVRGKKKFDWSYLWRTEKIELPETGLGSPTSGQRALIWTLVLFFGFQFLFPLRQNLYPGNPSWNGWGDLFAWRMMLDDKRGQAEFRLMDFKNRKELKIRTLDPEQKLHLNKIQQVSMLRQPDMLLQYAHFLEEGYIKASNGDVTKEDVKVFVRAAASLNGRDYFDMVKPGIDLTEVERGLLTAEDWIYPELPADSAPKRLSDIKLPTREEAERNPPTREIAPIEEIPPTT